jgi:hypothetical protein
MKMRRAKEVGEIHPPQATVESHSENQENREISIVVCEVCGKHVGRANKPSDYREGNRQEDPAGCRDGGYADDTDKESIRYAKCDKCHTLGNPLRKHRNSGKSKP